ncbi:lipopolysaccharide-induced tumor necrosis factor-alpha factor-like isoform X2 [Rhodnius prolixus]|uniref:Putative lipopolysaccharide-induced tumor necrosis factor-alpha factor n=2 Tax=Rhodnius prolixus TaxID=13249 RepID=A0A4P6DA31_RHOPR
MNYQKDAPPPYGPAIPSGPPPPMMNPATIVVPMTFGPDSQTLVCPSCHTTINTSIRKESTTKTHLFALLLCIIFCPLVCLPYCIDSCQASNHYCPKCGAYLGTYDS